MRNAYLNQAPTDSTMVTQNPMMPGKTNYAQNNTNNRTGRQNNSRNNNHSPPSTRPTFYTFKSSPVHTENGGAVLDSGACSSVVGKITLDKTLRTLEIDKLRDTTPIRDQHRFGTNPEAHKTICAVKFPFRCTDDTGTDIANFDVAFDVIEGDLPFLVGLPSLLAMNATLNFKYKSLGLSIGSRYVRIPLSHKESHLILPFTSLIKRSERNGQNSSSGSSPQYNHSPNQDYPSFSCYEPSDTSISMEHSTAPGRSEYGYYPSPPIMTTMVTNEEATPQPTTNNDEDSWNLSIPQLRKLHIQLKHATHTQICDYLKSAGIWKSTLFSRIKDAIKSCKCKLAFPPQPHPVAGPSSPANEAQTHLSIDVISIEGINYLHCVDRVTG